MPRYLTGAALYQIPGRKTQDVEEVAKRMGRRLYSLCAGDIPDLGGGLSLRNRAPYVEWSKYALAENDILRVEISIDVDEVLRLREEADSNKLDDNFDFMAGQPSYLALLDNYADQAEQAVKDFLND